MAKWVLPTVSEDFNVINETDIADMMDDNAFDLFQDECRKTAIYAKRDGVMYTALGLASEAGEYAGKVKKGIRDGQFDDQAAAAELGDVLWYVAMAAHELGYGLHEIANGVLAKLKDRANRDVIKGSGDNR